MLEEQEPEWVPPKDQEHLRVSELDCRALHGVHRVKKGDDRKAPLVHSHVEQCSIHSASTSSVTRFLHRIPGRVG